MNYLLIEILACLLIAGLIGVFIGWLLRGGCKNLLLENDNLWKNTLKDTNSSWENKIQGLMSKSRSTTESTNLKILTLQDKLNVSKENSNKIEADWSNKVEDINSKCEEKIDSLKRDNNNRLNASNQEILKVKNELELSQNRIKSIEEKLKSANNSINNLKSQNNLLEIEWSHRLDNTNSIWKKKTQKLVTQNSNKIDTVNREHSKLKDILELSYKKIEEFKIEIDTLNSNKKAIERKLKLADDAVSNAQLQNKLSESKWKSKLNDTDSSWEQKYKDLADINSNKINSVYQELSTVKNELIEYKSKNKKIESKLEKAEKDRDNFKENLNSLENSMVTIKAEKLKKDKNEVDLLNTIYDWKQRYKRLESEKSLNRKEKPKDIKEKIQTILNSDIGNIPKFSFIKKGKNNYNKLKNLKYKISIKSKRDKQSIKNRDFSKPTLLNKAKNGKKDNLTLVKGIGKVLEKRLNNLGIYHFEQISLWTEEQQAWIDARMSFPGRVEREAWVKQAKELNSGTETEFSKRVKEGEVPTSKQE